MAKREAGTAALRVGVAWLAGSAGALHLVVAAALAWRFGPPFFAVMGWLGEGGAAGDRLASGLAAAVLGGTLAFALVCGSAGLGLLSTARALRRDDGWRRGGVVLQAVFTLPVPLVVLALPDLASVVSQGLAVPVGATRASSAVLVVAEVAVFVLAVVLARTRPPNVPPMPTP